MKPIDNKLRMPTFIILFTKFLIDEKAYTIEFLTGYEFVF